MRSGFLLFVGLFLFACSSSNDQETRQVDGFQKDLIQLKEYFQIPGIAAMVLKGDAILYEDYLGYADLEAKQPLTAEVHFPIASITKVFSGVLAMQQVEEGRLSLENLVNRYIPAMGVDSSILVKHLLSHTSQGIPGEQFYYSSRFGAMTSVLTQSSGKDFAGLMQEKIFDPLDLKQTFLLESEEQVNLLGIKIAQPYAMNDAMEPGFIDYGYSASAGIVSTLHDLRIFNQALDNNTLIPEQSKQKMFQPFKKDLPYAYGIFSQVFDGQQLIWGYGQYDCYSSLLLKIPNKDLTLILLANNNLLSDPARLINGQATSSLFVLSFLQNFLYESINKGILEQEKAAKTSAVFNREKIKAQAQAAAFMARWDNEAYLESQVLLEYLFETYPAYESYADLNLLHTLSFLKDVAFYKDLEPAAQFDQQLENIGQQLLAHDPYNPYAHVYLANFHARKDHIEQARYHYESIVNLPNFAKNWYTEDATNWIKENLQ